MTNINKVSSAIVAQTPEFIESDYPLFNRFLEYYYQSQEKTGLGQNILNNFLGYLDIDRLDVGILDGKTKLVEAIDATSDTIVVESIDQFLEKSGSILIGSEVIYYESTTSSPNIALSPGISYDQVKLKWVNLFSPINLFDGTTTQFNLVSQDNPIAPPSAQHLIVSVYGEVLTPGTDYTVNGTTISLGGTVTTPDNNTTYSVSAVDGASVSEKIIRLTSGGNSGAGVDDDITLAVGPASSVPAGSNSLSLFLDRSSDTLTLSGHVVDNNTITTINAPGGSLATRGVPLPAAGTEGATGLCGIAHLSNPHHCAI